MRKLKRRDVLKIPTADRYIDARGELASHREDARQISARQLPAGAGCRQQHSNGEETLHEKPKSGHMRHGLGPQAAGVKKRDWLPARMEFASALSLAARCLS